MTTFAGSLPPRVLQGDLGAGGGPRNAPLSLKDGVAARWPLDDVLQTRLLVLDTGSGRVSHTHIPALPALLRAGDLLVLNDAATLPASLPATVQGGAGQGIEVRLAGPADTRFQAWNAVLFGPGDWRTPTERRPAPPGLSPGDVLRFGDALTATITGVSAISPRLVRIVFDPDGAALWAALYALGRPVQYSYLAGPLAPWHVQTAWAARPWAMEMPSAGHPLPWRLLEAVRQRGVGLATLTHAAGLSSTGDAALDAALPLPEIYELPTATVTALDETRRRGGRIVAVGTSVVRALEDNVRRGDGVLEAGRFQTGLRLGPADRNLIVDALLTGMHEPDTSHYDLMGAFAPPELLARGVEEAIAAGYRWHEFGDATLIVGG